MGISGKNVEHLLDGDQVRSASFWRFIKPHGIANLFLCREFDQALVIPVLESAMAATEPDSGGPIEQLKAYFDTVSRYNLFTFNFMFSARTFLVSLPFSCRVYGHCIGHKSNLPRSLLNRTLEITSTEYSRIGAKWQRRDALKK